MEILTEVLEHLPAMKIWIALGLGVLFGVEALATGIPMAGPTKRLVAILAGPVAGLTAYYLGLADIPLHGEYAPVHGDELRHVVGTGVFGLVGTLAAIGIHDLGGGELLKGISARLLGRTSTPATPAAPGGA
jgi:hypothetical protein